MIRFCVSGYTYRRTCNWLGPVYVKYDAYDGVGAGLDQEQRNGSMRPMAFISRAILDSETHWAPLDFQADFMSRVPESRTDHDHSRSVSFTPVEDGGILLI